MNEFKLVPHGPLADQIEADYRAMNASGMFIGEPPAFEEILDGLSLLERAINGGWRPSLLQHPGCGLNLQYGSTIPDLRTGA